MNNLFIVAHPDDEILGACGTIMKLKAAGDRIAIAVFSKKSKTRFDCFDDKILNIHKELGIDKTYLFDYEMMKFGQYDRYKMTWAIEQVLQEEDPDRVFIHDSNDVHNDHRVLSTISIEATKLPQRHANYAHPIKSIYTMEIPSSTDWGTGFLPNAFFEISEKALKTKEEILKQYDDVIRKAPHPRNFESFKSLARYRGGQAGVLYAEAFRKIFELETEGE